ncbi:MAG: phage tail family protein [Sphaerochaeta sp.]|jgi:glutaredoxin-related protein|nr:phage tail family protein [Sphaerochaeta sp.]
MKNTGLWGAREYVTHPEPISGVELDPRRGWISIISPEMAETVNMVKNPSFEKGTTGWAADVGTIAQSSVNQRRGLVSLRVTPSAGAAKVYYGTAFSVSDELIANVWYTFSIDLLGLAGSVYRIYFADTAGNRVGGYKEIRGKSFWERVSVTYQETANNDRRVYIEQVSGSNGYFYLDGAQLEALAYPTAYFDGDTLPLARSTNTYYYWGAVPHESKSRRLAGTPGGGREVNLLDVGYRVTAIVGLGEMPLNNVSTPNAMGGAYYQRSIPQVREFGIAGSILGETWADISAVRRELIKLIDPLTVPQPITLLFHVLSPLGDSDSEIASIVCVYESGLEMNLSDQTNERVGIIFKSYDPSIYSDNISGLGLAVQEDINAPWGVLEYDGIKWKSLDAGVTWTLGGRQVMVGMDGYLYVATAGGFYKYNQFEKVSVFFTAASMGDPIVQASPDKIYGNVAGQVSSYVPSTDAISAQVDVGGAVRDMLYYGTTLYICGSFTNAGGIPDADRIAAWVNDATLIAVGTGFNGVAEALAISPSGILYAGGSFTATGDSLTTLNRVAQWNGTAWMPIGSGFANGAVYCLMVDKAGALWAGGSFTKAGGSVADYVAKWNGVAWSEVGAGPGFTVYSLAQDAAGKIWATGALYSHMAKTWNGYSWMIPDLYNSSGGTILASSVDIFGDKVYVCHEGTPTNPVGTGFVISTASDNYVSNDGSGVTLPVIKISQAEETTSTIVSIKNKTTGKQLYFNYALSGGEEIVIDCAAGTIQSNLNANIANELGPTVGNLRGFYLANGNNTISAFCFGSGVGEVQAYISWKKTYSSIDYLIRRL